jgi:hypothetical protein
LSAEITTKQTLLIKRTEKESTTAKNPVYVEWYGLCYSVHNENVNTWKCKESSLESGKSTLSIIENIHGCANPGKYRVHVTSYHMFDNHNNLIIFHQTTIYKEKFSRLWDLRVVVKLLC